MINLKIKSQWDSSVCVQEMKRQFPGGKLENLKTQKLMNKVPFRRVEIPSKHGVLRNIYSFILDPATIWLNSLEKKGQTVCKQRIATKGIKQTDKQVINM